MQPSDQRAEPSGEARLNQIFPPDEETEIALHAADMAAAKGVYPGHMGVAQLARVARQAVIAHRNAKYLESGNQDTEQTN